MGQRMRGLEVKSYLNVMLLFTKSMRMCLSHAVLSSVELPE